MAVHCACVLSCCIYGSGGVGVNVFSVPSERRRRSPPLDRDRPSAPLQTAAKPLEHATRLCSAARAQLIRDTRSEAKQN